MVVTKKYKNVDFFVGDSPFSGSVIFNYLKATKVSNIIIGGVLYTETYMSINDTTQSDDMYYKMYVAKNYGIIRFDLKNNEYFERVF